MMAKQIKVLFVCLGNICRSPLAEGAFRRHVSERDESDRFVIDSAGTSAYHVGEKPDPRSIKTAQKNGVDISLQRARQFVESDFQQFDYIVAMDQSNYENIERIKRGTGSAKISLMLSELDSPRRDVPDPYYGGDQGFDEVWKMVDTATNKLLQRIKREAF